MKLFTVGPVEMYPETLEQSVLQLPYFRTAEFSELVLRAESLLLELAGAPENARAVFLTASGTGGMEAAVMNCLGAQDKALIIDGGSFGHRFVQICERHGIPKETVKLEFGVRLTEEMLDKAYTEDMTALLVNLHETSTGQLYDIDLIHNFCVKYNLFLIVDAISCFLADPINMERFGIDVMITSSQKALALAPGISLVILSPRAIDIAQKRICNTIYFDFQDYLKNGERGQTPFTPAVGTLLTMYNRLEYIVSVGIESIQGSIRELAFDFRKKVEGLPVEIPEYPHSNALTPIYFPHKNAKQVYETLYKEYALNVTPSGGELGDLLLRVGHIGNLTTGDNDQLIHALYEILE